MDYRTLSDDARDLALAWTKIDEAANLVAGTELLTPELRGWFDNLRTRLAQMEEDTRAANRWEKM